MNERIIVDRNGRKHITTEPLLYPQQPQPEQEPVAWDGDCVLGHCGSPAGCEASNCCRADYTTPPQRKPLTETEIRTLRRDLAGTLDVQYVTFARAIEAAHGIK